MDEEDCIMSDGYDVSMTSIRHAQSANQRYFSRPNNAYGAGIKRSNVISEGASRRFGGPQ
jgi:hypothetical protein